jgi:hypothetical protein
MDTSTSKVTDHGLASRVTSRHTAIELHDRGTFFDRLTRRPIWCQRYYKLRPTVHLVTEPDHIGIGLNAIFRKQLPAVLN